ncbi:MAG: hypothetical protein AAF357_17260, partial [Verrucomicrobiota bacterium]
MNVAVKSALYLPRAVWIQDNKTHDEWGKIYANIICIVPDNPRNIGDQAKDQTYSKDGTLPNFWISSWTDSLLDAAYLERRVENDSWERLEEAAAAENELGTETAGSIVPEEQEDAAAASLEDAAAENVLGTELAESGLPAGIEAMWRACYPEKFTVTGDRLGHRQGDLVELCNKVGANPRSLFNEAHPVQVVRNKLDEASLKELMKVDFEACEIRDEGAVSFRVLEIRVDRSNDFQRTGVRFRSEYIKYLVYSLADADSLRALRFWMYVNNTDTEK